MFKYFFIPFFCIFGIFTAVTISSKMDKRKLAQCQLDQKLDWQTCQLMLDAGRLR